MMPLMTYGDTFVFSRSYGLSDAYGSHKRWRRHRRAAHDGFNPSVVAKLQPIHLQAVSKTVLSMLACPEDWYQEMGQCVLFVHNGPQLYLTRHGQFCSPNIFSFAGLGILRSVYNWPSDSPSAGLLVNHAQKLAETFATSVIPGAYLVELIPLMKYLPAWTASWKRKVLQWHEKYSEILDGLREDVAASLVRYHLTEHKMGSDCAGIARRGRTTVLRHSAHRERRTPSIIKQGIRLAGRNHVVSDFRLSSQMRL